MIKSRSNYSSSFSLFARSLFLVLFLFLAQVDEASSATPLLRCQLSQSGDIQTLDFVPVSDPYTVKAVDINGRFRFKAVVIGSEQQIDYITLYVYYRAKRQWVLLHQAKYFPPFNQAVFPSASLTGVNYVYSPVLGRELQYSCALLAVAP
jgi:hypothetical protein